MNKLIAAGIMGLGFLGSLPASAWWWVPPDQEYEQPPEPPKAPGRDATPRQWDEWRAAMDLYLERLQKWARNWERRYGSPNPDPGHHPDPDPDPDPKPRPDPDPKPQPDPDPDPDPTPDPDPDPKPSPEGCQQPSDLFLNPFNKDSAHHRPIGRGAKYSGPDDAITRSLRSFGFGYVNVGNGWGTNIFDAGNGAVMQTIKYASETGQGRLNPFAPFSLMVPPSAENGNKTDSVVVIKNGDTAHQFYQFRSRSWRARHWPQSRFDGPSAALHRKWSFRGKGHSEPDGELVGTSASGVAGAFGVLRGWEVNKPGQPIQHVLQFALDDMQLAHEIVWPASGMDTSCAQNRSCRGNVPYGTLLALPQSSGLQRDDLTEVGNRLADALTYYGGYVIDRSSGPTTRGDQEIRDDVADNMRLDMLKIWPHLLAVMNNEENQVASGGGEPLAPNCAFDAGG